MATSTTAVSARKIEANRRNASKSTGPRTAEGKARSSRNSVTHGIFCQDLVLPGEDPQAFAQLRRELIDEHKPQTITELFLVDRMASGMWKLARVTAAEQLAHQAVAQQMKELYAQSLKEDEEEEEEEEENADELIKLARLMRPLPEPVPSSVSTYGLMMPVDGRKRQAYLERLSLYEKRIEGTVHRCLRDLKKLRTPAKGEVVPEDISPYLEYPTTVEAEPSPLPARGKSSIPLTARGKSPIPLTAPGVPGEGVSQADAPAEAVAGESVAIGASKMKNEATADPIVERGGGEIGEAGI